MRWNGLPGHNGGAIDTLRVQRLVVPANGLFDPMSGWVFQRDDQAQPTEAFDTSAAQRERVEGERRFQIAFHHGDNLGPGQSDRLDRDAHWV